MNAFEPTGGKAPKGGAVSAYTGEFYKGGQFMPESALPANKRKVRAMVAKFEIQNVRFIKVRPQAKFYPVDPVTYTIWVTVSGEDEPRRIVCVTKPDAMAFVADIYTKAATYLANCKYMPVCTDLDADLIY